MHSYQSPRDQYPRISLLSDGVRAFERQGQERTAPPWLIVNLAGEEAPLLSVDRRRVIDWSAGQALIWGELPEAGVRALDGRTDFSFATLSHMCLAFPKSMGRLDERCRSGDSPWRMHLGRLVPDVVADVRQCGFSPIDWLVEVIVGGPRSHAAIAERLAASSPFFSQRLAQLREAGAAFPSAFDILARFVSTSKPLPRALSTVLLLKQGSLGALEWSDRLSVEAILEFAAASYEPLTFADVLAIAEPLAAFGYALPEVPESLRAVEISPQLLELMSRNLDGKAPWLDALTLPNVLRASLSWQVSPGEVLAIAEPLIALGYTLPDVPEALQVGELSEPLLELIPRNLDGQKPWRDPLTLSDVLRASLRFQVSPAEVLANADLLIALGYTLPEVPEALQAVEISPELRRLMSRDFDGAWPWLDSLTLPDVLRASLKWGTSPAEVLAVAQPLAAFGYALPEVPEALHAGKLSERLLELISRNFDGRYPWLDALSVPDVLRASFRWEVLPGKVLAIAEPLIALGYTLPDVPETLQVVEFSPGQTRLFDNPRVVGSLSELGLLIAGADNNLTSDEAWDLTAPLAGFGISIPPRPPVNVRPELASMISRGNQLNAIGLVLAARKGGCEIGSYREAITALGELGIDVEEALAFCDFVEAKDKSSKSTAW